MSFAPLNPRPMLQTLIDNDVRVKLKWGQEYTGRLVSVDSYMNVHLSSAEEWSEGRACGTVGQILIRCNNVLWVSALRDGEKGAANGDTKMAG